MNEEMSKLLKIGEVKNFSKYEDTIEFLRKQEKSYRWTSITTSTMEFLPAETPNSKIGLLTTDGITPIGPTAHDNVLMRTRANCPALTSLTQRRGEDVAADDICLILNTLAPYSETETQVCFGDGYVLAALSQDYVRVPAIGILQAVDEELCEFEYREFRNALVSHESYSFEYRFVDNEVCDNLEECFKQLGLKEESYSTLVKVMSSEVGLSGANIYPLLKKGKQLISIGLPIKMEHIGEKCSIETFRNNLKQCFASFKDISIRLQMMHDTEIHYPADCMYQAGKKALLPAKYLKVLWERVKDEFPYHCTGLDIYFKLFEILDMCSENEKYTDLRMMQLSENITRIAFYDLKKYDTPLPK